MNSENKQILAAIIVFFVIISISSLINQNYIKIPELLLYSALIIILAVSAKKLTAHWLDAQVEHEIWSLHRYGFWAHKHFKKPKPAGIIFPLLFSIISLGIIKFAAILTFEPKASKHRAAKRHGFHSFKELTDFHISLIAASSTIVLLILSAVSYAIGFEYLTKMAIYYTFWNMLPISKLDGAQTFYGNRTLYTILGSITILFTAFALLI